MVQVTYGSEVPAARSEHKVRWLLREMRGYAFVRLYAQPELASAILPGLSADKVFSGLCFWPAEVRAARRRKQGLQDMGLLSHKLIGVL